MCVKWACAIRYVCVMCRYASAIRTSLKIIHCQLDSSWSNADIESKTKQKQTAKKPICRFQELGHTADTFSSFDVFRMFLGTDKIQMICQQSAPACLTHIVIATIQLTKCLCS